MQANISEAIYGALFVLALTTLWQFVYFALVATPRPKEVRRFFAMSIALQLTGLWVFAGYCWLWWHSWTEHVDPKWMRPYMPVALAAAALMVAGMLWMLWLTVPENHRRCWYFGVGATLAWVGFWWAT